MVTLIYYERPSPASAGINLWNASGFAVEVNGKWWLVTAGHYVKDLLAHAKDRRVTAFFACDAWGGSDGRGRPVPLPRDPSRWFLVGDGDTLDYGVIELGPLLVANLRAGKIVAVPESDWRNTPADFDFYLLLGTPLELITTNVPAGEIPTVYNIKRGIIEVAKVARPPVAKVTPHERFYGELCESDVVGGIKVKDIGGMSGGPVFGCRRRPGNGFDYWAVAVQSGWYASEKIIVADYLVTLAEVLHGQDTTK